jgi:uncharacterized DUF497 family protein
MFAWDEAKRRANLKKHGVVYRTLRRSSAELLSPQGDDIRSIRKATKHEARYYFSQIFD